MKKSNVRQSRLVGKTIRTSLLLVALFLTTQLQFVMAQQPNKISISGVVTDDSGEALIGASVKVKGTTIGKLTNINGEFSLEIPLSATALYVSYLGLQSQTIAIGNTRKFQIRLKENTETLNEVVVTALGIERKAKSLTYATQSVGGKELTRAKDVNLINSLQGKSAGLSITPNSSGAGGGASKILLRGQTSILGNNQPLIVLDGIPLSNGMGGQAGSNIVYGGSKDGGDLLSTINPDDVASMTILKGANAAALYGSQANNGVIIIKTKSGRDGNIRIDISSNTMVETPIMLPQIQSVYGGKIQGYFMTLDGWGKPIVDITPQEMARMPYLTNSPVNNLRNFFQTGVNFNNSISLNGGNENYNTYFSYGNTSAKGLIENNTFYRHNVMFKNHFKLFNKRLNIDLSINYIHQGINNKPIVGKALSPLLALYRMPRNADIRYFQNNYQHTALADDPFVTSIYGNRKLEGHQIQSWPWFDQYINNPYWLLNKSNSNTNKDRILSSLTIKWNILEGLTAQARLSIDQNIDRDKSTDYATLNLDSRLKGGRYWSGRYYNSDIFSDYLVTYDKNISENVTFNATAGTSFKRKYRLSMYAQNYIDTAALPNVFLPENHRLKKDQSSLTTVENWGTNWEAGLFATAQFGLWNVAYIDGSYRIDWSKAFQQFATPGKYKSFGYYSVGANALLKELIFKDVDAINEMKMRVSFSEVGNSIPDRFYSARGINFNSGAYSPPNATFDNPLPETTRSLEVGIDGIMLKNRLNFDITLYQSIMSNQFLEIQTSSGQNKPINSGKVRNRGVELSASYRLSFNRKFTWTPGVNLAYNDNLILSTYRDSTGKAIPMEVGPKEFKIKYIEGRPYGDLYANSFKRDAQGLLIIDQTGTPEMETGKYETFIGNATPKFTFGVTNTLSYKDFSLYILIDGKVGGKVLSITESDLDANGLSQRTADARAKAYPKTYTLDGKQITDMFFTLPNGQEVSVEKYYKTVGANPNELYAYDATNVRLREMSLGYTFRDLFGSSKNLTLSFVARNLFFIYKNSPVDPDISLSAANGFGGIDVYSLPTTRNIGLNIKVTL